MTMAAVLAALDYCDEAVKATESADNLRSQIKDYLEDSSQARMEADEARRENEKLKRRSRPCVPGWSTRPRSRKKALRCRAEP